MCSRPRPMTLKSPDDLDGVEVIRAGQRENPDRWSPGTRLSGGSGGPLGTLGPVAALGPVRVLGAAAWVGGAAPLHMIAESAHRSGQDSRLTLLGRHCSLAVYPQ